MSTHPLAEVFGFPADNLSSEAAHYRKNRLCPFNNKVPSCTKDKANNPLGVCSIYEGEDVAITCPVRFRQDWLIAVDAAAFFFAEGTAWTSLTEIRLNDRNGKSAGNIDIVLISYDDQGQILDFGALEIQAVYISGNVRTPFEFYMEDPSNRYAMDWTDRRDSPRPDYLSSSRKRLAPQLIYKGGILNSWRKKLAVATHSGFYNTLPVLPEVNPEEADIAWLVYELQRDANQNRYKLVRTKTVYTQFTSALQRITSPEPGPVEDFIKQLQRKFDEKKPGDSLPPDAPTLTDIFG
jgi:hypothetical protein